MTPELLIVAGEASGDRIAASVARASKRLGARCWGVGGPAARSAGVETLADAERLGVMGLGDVAVKLPAVANAALRLAARVRRAPPSAALLVNFTELNLRLGRWLRRRRVPVLWCVAPQAWAWRPGRFRTVSGAVDRLAVILPFEEPLWRAQGVDARYVGHPSVEPRSATRAEARARLGLGDGRALAVLPGSRAGEIRRLAPLFCRAAADLRKRGRVTEVRVLASPALDASSAEVLRAAAAGASLEVVPVDPELGAAALLSGFDAALCASGTACLEAAIAGAPPVIAYRVDWLTYRAARWLLRTPHVGLPNVLLGRRAFPELLQDDATGSRIAAAAEELLVDGRARQEALAAGAEVRDILAAPAGGTFGERVAALLEPWLDRP